MVAKTCAGEEEPWCGEGRGAYKLAAAHGGD